MAPITKITSGLVPSEPPQKLASTKAGSHILYFGAVTQKWKQREYCPHVEQREYCLTMVQRQDQCPQSGSEGILLNRHYQSWFRATTPVHKMDRTTLPETRWKMLDAEVKLGPNMRSV